MASFLEVPLARSYQTAANASIAGCRSVLVADHWIASSVKVAIVAPSWRMCLDDLVALEPSCWGRRIGVHTLAHSYERPVAIAEAARKNIALEQMPAHAHVDDPCKAVVDSYCASYDSYTDV